MVSQAEVVTRRVVIADAGPLIALARIEKLDLLRELFGFIWITRAVCREIFPDGASFADEGPLYRSLIDGWVYVVDSPPSTYATLNPGIDEGEASAIQTAYVWRESGEKVLLVMDDRAGRREATRVGITIIGTAGVIGLAKTQGLIPSARPLLNSLIASGYFIGSNIVAAVLRQLGE